MKKQKRTFKAVRFPSMKENGIQHVYPFAGSRTTQIADIDRRTIKSIRSCSFMRKYIPGEFQGVPFTTDIDLSEVASIMIVMPATTDHLAKHLGNEDPIAILLDDYEGSTHARVLLSEEQGKRVKGHNLK